MLANKRFSGAISARAACNIGATRFDVSNDMQPTSRNNSYSRFPPSLFLFFSVLSRENTISTISYTHKVVVR